MWPIDISKDEHFRRLGETTEHVWPVIEKIIQTHLRQNGSESIGPDMEVFLAKRRGKPLLRPYLTRIAYEIAGGECWQEMTSLLAAPELLNISTYQSNMCFDSKRDGWGATTANNQFISSMITLSLALLAIHLQDGLSDRSRQQAMALISECNSSVYQGQHADLNQLCIAKAEYYLASDAHVFIDDYLRRCHLIGGSMFNVAQIGLLAVNPDHRASILLKVYFSALGTAGQIINDLADYFPDANRPYASQYSDLRMGRFTYPTYLLLKGGYPPDLFKLERAGDKMEDYLKSATQWLQSNNAGGAARQLLRNVCWPDIKRAISAMTPFCSMESLAPLTFAKHFVFESRMLRYFIN
jgi:geranylgeranyl pyrophosphate synthase